MVLCGRCDLPREPPPSDIGWQPAHSLSITVAGPFLTKKASLILYVLRTCPVQIRPGNMHEAAIYRGSRSPKYLQIEWRNCNASVGWSRTLLMLSRSGYARTDGQNKRKSRRMD